jgi:MFS family permease
MLVGDMVNEKQKGLAYSIQSFLCNAGSIVGYVFPFLLTWLGFRNTAAAGVIPETVVWSFYIGAAILLACVIYTLVKVKEWPPEVYREYNGGPEVKADGKKEKTNVIKLLVNAPSNFWSVGLVQFFCWFAFLFMWTYTNGTVAKKAFDCPETTTVTGLSQLGTDGKAESTYSAKYILTADTCVMVDHGKPCVAGIVTAEGEFVKGGNVELNGKTVATDGLINTVDGKAEYSFDESIDAVSGVVVNGEAVATTSFKLVDYLSQMTGKTDIILADIYTHDPKTGALFLDGVKNATLSDASNARFETSIVLNTESPQYNDAGNWVGILFAVQAIGSVLWAIVLPIFRSRKFSYSLSLILGGVGFISAGFITDPYLLFVSFLLIGCAWAAMLAWPFTILTNSLQGGNIGAYLGLFNCSICIPQIVGALLGGVILSALGSPDALAPQYLMMVIAGISLFLGALAVVFIKEHVPSNATVES